MFWTILQILVAIILTVNSSIPIFILAAFLNGFSMGGSVGQRIVLIIDLIGQKLLVIILYVPYGPYDMDLIIWSIDHVMNRTILAIYKNRIFQRPFLVLENIFVAPVAFLMPQLFVMLADKFNNPSLTYCPLIFGGLINLTIIFLVYRKDKQKL